MNRGLLEELAGQVGVPFLSDLRMSGYRGELIQKLTAIRAEEYSLTEWQDAIHYLLGKTESAARDVREAKAFLIGCLKR